MHPSTEIVPSHPKNADELIADISRLMAEAEEMLSESTSHHAEENQELFRERNRESDNPLGDRYVAAKAKIATAARSTGKIIRMYPYESAALALGIGLLMGACLSRKSN